MQSLVFDGVSTCDECGKTRECATYWVGQSLSGPWPVEICRSCAEDASA